MSASAEELVQAGKLSEALDSLQQRIRKDPSEPNHRIFLFQLLAILGQWKRALAQLDVIKDLEMKAWPMVHAYREAVNCELHREAVFQGKVKPLVFGEPQEWMALLLEAQRLLAEGKTDAFLELNAQAFEKAPAGGGKINDEPFEWLADADQRFGPVFEMIFNEQYYWVPMHSIRSLHTEAPSDLRDLIWLPAEVTWTNGGQSMVMIPARYPQLSGLDDEFLLSRKSDWQDHGQDLFEGLGQRMLATDAADYPILQVRSIEFEG